MVGIRPLITDQRCWRCPKTCTIGISSQSNGATCTQCLPLFTCTPTYPLTRAYSVHPGPCNGNPRPTSSTSVSSSLLYIFFCDSCICFMVLPPCHGYGITASLEFLGLRFVNARFPYLFCVTFLCVLRSCSVVVHICMRVWYIYCPLLPPTPLNFSVSGCDLMCYLYHPKK